MSSQYGIGPDDDPSTDSPTSPDPTSSGIPPSPDPTSSGIPDSPNSDPDTTLAAGDDQGDQTTGPDPDSVQAPGANLDPMALHNYVSGADAMNPDDAAAAEQQIDPNGDLSPQERAIKAIAQAAQQGDKQKAWGLMQHHRNSFNVKRHAARAALANGNKREAVRLANSAMGHIPNGMHVHMTPHASGVHVAFHRFAGKKKGRA